MCGRSGVARLGDTSQQLLLLLPTTQTTTPRPFQASGGAQTGSSAHHDRLDTRQHAPRALVQLAGCWWRRGVAEQASEHGRGALCNNLGHISAFQNGHHAPACELQQHRGHSCKPSGGDAAPVCVCVMRVCHACVSCVCVMCVCVCVYEGEREKRKSTRPPPPPSPHQQPLCVACHVQQHTQNHADALSEKVALGGIKPCRHQHDLRCKR
jgi:hypothetical protein